MMLINYKFLGTTLALICITTAAHAQNLTSSESLSRQMQALRAAVDSWKTVVDAEFATVNVKLTDIDERVTSLEDSQGKMQAVLDQSHACGAKVMLYDGTGCVPIPIQSTETPPSKPDPATPEVPTKPDTNKPQCSASKAICDIYQSELGRLPDQAGAMFWQGEIDRLVKTGKTLSEAQASVKAKISQSNESQGVERTFEEVKNYNNYAKTNKIDNPMQSCTSGTKCNTTALQHVVETGYEQILDRKPDAAGGQFYQELLESGKISVEEFFDDLRNSPEAQNK